jgi:magnesium transporter
MKKELTVGLMNGAVFAIVVGTIAALWYGQVKLGVVIAVAILFNLLAGALAGALVPVVLRRLSIDPALAGGVVLTTVTDIVGIFAFVGLATFVLLEPGI